MRIYRAKKGFRVSLGDSIEVKNWSMQMVVAHFSPPILFFHNDYPMDKGDLPENIDPLEKRYSLENGDRKKVFWLRIAALGFFDIDSVARKTAGLPLLDW